MKKLSFIMDMAKKVWESLKSEHSKKDAEKILEITDDFKKKVVKIFGIAEDAADDAVAIATIVMNALERLNDETVARAVVKPVKDIVTAEDITVMVVHGYRALMSDNVI